MAVNETRAVTPAVQNQIAELVGDAARVTARRDGLLRRAVRGAISGQRAGTTLTVDDGVDELSTFAVELPDVDDLAPGPIAEAITTAVSIRARFVKAMHGFRRMSFDLSDSAMRTGHMAGNAHLNLATIHLNASYIIESSIVELQARGALLPMRVLVAHELWHLIELAWEVRDYQTTIAFRRDLGAYFGAPTIEQVLRGDDALLERLRREVSDYATKNPKEATAEMFEQWWTGRSDSPAVARFGELVERYFPR